MKIFKVKFFLLILILFSLISVSAVSAGEDDLKNSSQGNFTELNQEFSNSVDSVNLTKDFVHGDEEDDLKISKSINIDGNNHSIDFKNNSSLNINNTLNLTVVFKNIHFNGKFNITLNNENSINLSFIDCCFLGNADELNNSFVSSYYDLNVTKCFTGIITKDIEDLAWNIVGKSQGIDAAKKLAKWVGKKFELNQRLVFTKLLHKQLLENWVIVVVRLIYFYRCVMWLVLQKHVKFHMFM
ncbi:MAG: hypothetical protein J6P09_07590 [Methanobrevibacter sp.]|nr:hypothetical protein [Methanobrevibacter sp.]